MSTTVSETAIRQMWLPLRGRTLKGLVETQRSIEKARVALGNRLSALGRDDEAKDVLDPEAIEMYKSLHTSLITNELECERHIKRLLAQHPVWPWMTRVKGMGPSLGGKLLALLLPPLEGRGPSTWYKAAGLYVVERDGQSHIPRRTKGEKITWHPHLRTTCYLIGESFVRTGGYYRERYDEFKAAFLARHEGDEAWPPWRIDRVARIRTVKLFLSHAYRQWADESGVEITEPYPIQILGHTGMLPVPDPDGGGVI